MSLHHTTSHGWVAARTAWGSWGASAAPAGLSALSLVILVWPGLLASRFAFPIEPAADLDAVQVTRALARGLGAIGLVFGVRALVARAAPTLAHARVLHALSVAAAFVAATYPLAGWLIDDAAITFAYSENLARGHGLVLHPSQAPEEAYSNTLWMLLLAGARLLGVELPLAAKVLGVTCGLLSVLVALWAIERLQPERSGQVAPVVLSLLFGAPMIVWSASGLEHPLQALLLLLAAVAPLIVRRPVWLQAWVFSALMLIRPETPLLLACVWFASAGHQVVVEGASPRVALARWPLLALPGLTLLGLSVFRAAYFGDLLPNPYYAKAAGASVGRVVNLVGGSWDYVFTWLSGSAAVITVPAVVAIPWRRAPLAVWLAAAVALGQVGFVLYAQGDWMGCHRFIAPLLPTFALLVGYGAPELLKALAPVTRPLVIGAMAGALALGAIKQLHTFILRPTAPFQTVAAIGLELRALGERLGLAEPRLAHHDAGGTSYAARLDLVDLAGLANRSIAKRHGDADFVADYVLARKRPHFIFGSADIFPATISLNRRPEFHAQYVRMVFPGRPHMAADLCHVRRDLADHRAFEPVRENGELVEVIVRPPRSL